MVSGSTGPDPSEAAFLCEGHSFASAARDTPATLCYLPDVTAPGSLRASGPEAGQQVTAGLRAGPGWTWDVFGMVGVGGVEGFCVSGSL